MKEQDIMLGDWVKCEGKPYRITQIGDILDMANDEKSWLAYPEEVSPIPLTLEILEKNGFENDFYEEESVADYHAIRLEGYTLKYKIGQIDGYLVTWCNGGVNVTTDYNGCVQKDISFVHELQHALRLCGIEKEIEL